MATRMTAARPRARRAAAPPGRGSPIGTPRLFLGVDPGLNCTGYAILAASPGSFAPCVVDAGIIRTAADRPLAERLAEIDSGIREILAEHAVCLVAVEELYAHYKHPRTAILMGHARGAVLLAAARRGLPVASLPATAVKKTLTGNGHASKIQMQRAIASTFRLRRLPEPADIADAMAIAWCAAMNDPLRDEGRTSKTRPTIAPTSRDRGKRHAAGV